MKSKARNAIASLSKQIAQQFQPQKIVLFGSYAYGKPDADSDVDLLVVMPFEGRSVRQAIKIRQCISTVMPLDLMVRTPDQIRERIQLGDYFIKEIIERGTVLYESQN